MVILMPRIIIGYGESPIEEVFSSTWKIALVFLIPAMVGFLYGISIGLSKVFIGSLPLDAIYLTSGLTVVSLRIAKLGILASYTVMAGSLWAFILSLITCAIGSAIRKMKSRRI